MAPDTTSQPDEPLSDEDLLQQARRAREEAVRFFSSSNKAVRERWVVLEFLSNLGRDVAENQLASVSDDPPDVMYEDCRFEVKEILDPGRRRHQEFKVALSKANAATSSSELWETSDARTIVHREIEELVLKDATALCEKYPPQVRKSLDLLFYVSLTEVFGYVADPLVHTADIDNLGFRSVSFLAGPLAGVVGSSTAAPSLLAECRGQVRRKDSRNGAI